MHPTNVVGQRTDGALRRTPHVVWKARAIDGVEQLIDIRVGNAFQDVADLADAIQSMSPETVDRLDGIFEGLPVRRIQRGGFELPQALE